MKNSSFKVTCPCCGNTLGVMEDDVLVIQKKGRIVRMTVWEEAVIVCEECKTDMVVKRYRDSDRKQWNGMLDSRGREEK